ncbi:MAG: DUF5317 domain-containing protein [Actinomycetota bacterium]|nr:DUF5317 domain-containing protein [Actinomycetota bacterium]
MLLVLGVIVGGILLGLVTGGSLRTLAAVRFRLWPLALIGLALQLVPVPGFGDPLERWIGAALLVVSYLLILAFILENIQFPGFPVVLVGILLNVFVISLNRGMPVSDEALRKAYGPDYQETRQALIEGGGAKHHLERPDDLLMPLADSIPIGAPVRNVFSPGDLIAYLGVMWVLASATRGGGGKHRIGAPARRQFMDESSRAELSEFGV